ncbi:unnamed protein product [Parascedosporium putredinis]|uniref:Uncharacterized protein n=1 Tax=Parascedosporium putredinis TaxID=1442378 RepID=A0A9P1M7V8_9PEZI|nr:unnamed protein product [Parascedosporium putredinis]CAI7992434.1 unnamed protein product [Parascedosporium putredinis]
MAQVPTRHPSPPRKLYSELESVPGFADGSHSPRTFAHETGDLGTDRHSDSDESGDSARSEEGGVSGSTGYLSGNQRERRIEASPPMIGKPLEEESLASQLRGIKKLREVADKEGQYGWSSVHAPFTWRPVNISDYEGDYDSGEGPKPLKSQPGFIRERLGRLRPVRGPRTHHV